MPTLLGRLRRSLTGNPRGRRSEQYQQTASSTITSRPPSKVLIPTKSSSVSSHEVVSPVSVFDVEYESFDNNKQESNWITNREDKQYTQHSQASTIFSMGGEEEQQLPPSQHQFSQGSSTATTRIQWASPPTATAMNNHDPLESTLQSEATTIVSMVVSPTTTTRRNDNESRRIPLLQINENLPPPSASKSSKSSVSAARSRHPDSTHAFPSKIVTHDDNQNTTFSMTERTRHEEEETSSDHDTTQTTRSIHLVSPSQDMVAPSSVALNSQKRDVLVGQELFRSQRRVYIEKGGNRHKMGTVLGTKDSRTLEVQLDNGAVVGVRMTSVRYIDDSEKTVTETSEEASSAVSTTLVVETDDENGEPSTASNEEQVKPQPNKPTNFISNEINRKPSSGSKAPLSESSHIGRKVLITKGRNKNAYAVILGMKTKGMYVVELLASGKEVKVRVSSVECCDSGAVQDDAEPARRAHKSSTSDPRLYEPATKVQSPNVDALPCDETVVAESKWLPSPVVQGSLELQNTLQPRNISRPFKNSKSSNERRNNPCKENGKLVEVMQGPNTRKRGRIIGKSNAITYNIEVNADEIIGVRTSNVKILGSQYESGMDEEGDQDGSLSQRSNFSRRSRRFFRVLMPKDSSGNLFAGYKIKRVQVEGSVNGRSNKAGTNFLDYTIGDRLLSLDVAMKGSKQKKFSTSLTQNGKTYELISAKIEEDKDSGFKFGKPKVARLLYVDTSHCVDGSSFCVKDFLSQIGNFSVLNPRKIAARLELFQSPARFGIQEVDSKHFCDIEEEGHVGCGFIEEDFLRSVCEKGGLGKSKAALVSAIQVRLFVPSMGVYKGMLQRKRITSGPAIQLPPSMKKVPASLSAGDNKRAFIVVCQAGIHPSPGSANEFIGRKLDSDRGDHPPPVKSFTAKISKPLSDMVLDLWKSLGVPERDIQNYKKESLKPDRRNHAWVVGVADSTGSLPPDRIFVPGMGGTQPQELFVTRSPCLKHDHGRLLRTVNSKPTKMSKEEWDELQSLPFGSIIFSSPRKNKMSMPERIACGDLDGDLYLICWDSIILSQMKDVEPMQEIPMEDDGVLKTVAPDPNWLEAAHGIMTEAGPTNELGALVGALYKLSEKTAKKSPLHKRDPDAIAYADAYNEALEYKKHGRPIQLPAHLEKDMPKKLRHLINFV